MWFQVHIASFGTTSWYASLLALLCSPTALIFPAQLIKVFALQVLHEICDHMKQIAAFG